MDSIKVVFFDVGGVLLPQPQVGIAKYAAKIGVSNDILTKVFTHNQPNNAFCRLERGELLITDFFPIFEEEFHNILKRHNLSCDLFSAEELFKCMDVRDPNKRHSDMFNAVQVLRNNGFKVGVITNNWIENRDELKHEKSKLFVSMRLHFDVVIESCKVGLRKPDVEIYKLALKSVGAKPNEAVFLDDIGNNLKTASQLGIRCIRVRNIKKALQELSSFIKIDLDNNINCSSDVSPLPVHYDTIAHCYAEVQPGIVLHYVDIGEGPVVMLLHGFPEIWYTWRNQINALCIAGYRVIAMDLPGYGESSCPEDISAYSQENLCKCAVGLMDRLQIATSIVIGHDWGGALVWNLALKYPDRVSAVCSVNTPYFCHEGLELLRQNLHVFDYQVYFQKPGVAEKELEEDVSRTINIFFSNGSGNTTHATKNKSLFKGIPLSHKTKILNQHEVDYFVKNFSATGFRGGLNYYRNGAVNKKWEQATPHRKILCPALMITTEHDKILQAEFTKGMEKEIPNLARVHIKDSGHWSTFDKPQELNAAMINWLRKLKNVTNKAKL